MQFAESSKERTQQALELLAVVKNRISIQFAQKLALTKSFGEEKQGEDKPIKATERGKTIQVVCVKQTVKEWLEDTETETETKRWSKER